MVNKIESFTGDYAFLSNFYPVKMDYDAYIFPTLENAFQAAKSHDPQVWDQMTKCSPKESKIIGRKIKLRHDWERVKLDIMEQLLNVKFSSNNPILRNKLVATRGIDLIEGNWWGDHYWGVCNSHGQNHLGKLLMRIRNEIILGINKG